MSNTPRPATLPTATPVNGHPAIPLAAAALPARSVTVTGWRVVGIPPHRVLPDPDNPPERVRDVSDLLTSFAAVGRQLVPGIVSRHAELAELFNCHDGHRRLETCRIRGCEFLAVVLDHAPTRAEIRRIRVATGISAKTLTPAQLCIELENEMAETGCNQENAAVALGITAGYASKLLSRKRLPAELHWLYDNPNISRDAIRVIATRPTEEQQRQLAEKAKALLDQGKHVKRDLAERWAAELKGRGGKRRGPMKIKFGSVTAIIAGKPSDSLRAFIAKGAEALKELDRKGWDDDMLPGLMR